MLVKRVKAEGDARYLGPNIEKPRCVLQVVYLTCGDSLEEYVQPGSSRGDLPIREARAFHNSQDCQSPSHALRERAGAYYVVGKTSFTASITVQRKETSTFMSSTLSMMTDTVPPL